MWLVGIVAGEEEEEDSISLRARYVGISDLYFC